MLDRIADGRTDLVFDYVSAGHVASSKDGNGVSLMPFGGPGEAAAIAFFGGLFLVAVSRGFVAIRSHQVDRHREWMIRAFAIAIGIATGRVVSAVFDIALTPVGLEPKSLFVLSLWTGWAVTLGAGEL